jgi:single-stranded-DNA-specific exonuclease
MVYVQSPSPPVEVARRPRWIEPEPLPADLPALHPDPVLTELLYRRNIRDAAAAAEFLRAEPRPAPDLSRLPNIERAVERIARAIMKEERIAVFGDYDADGICATALLTRALRSAMREPSLVKPRLPTREEGYGLNQRAIAELAKWGATLLIAVDCGSTDNRLVGEARRRGLDVIVVDHHHMDGRDPPDAIVLSAYLQPDSPYRELSAAGVVYLLVAALAQHGHPVNGGNGEPETALLDYVALGTIGDVSPLIGANRALVRDGLHRLRRPSRPGLAALCQKAGLDPANLTADRVAFKLVPRLNAAGRMADPHLALELLLTDDPVRAEALANELERLNEERRSASERVAHEAEEAIRQQPDWQSRSILVVAGQGWAAGVLGLAANQLVSRFGRPVIVLSDDGTVSKGSARSVPGFDVVAALGACRDLLEAWGGHSQAAGLALPSQNLAKLLDALEGQLATAGLDLPLQPVLRLDAELPPDRLTLDTARAVDRLQPFGAGNEQPLFLIRGVTVRQYDVIGQDGKHLRLTLGTPGGAVRAVAFGAAARSRELVPHRSLDVAATVNLDLWNGRERLDLEIKDFRPAR